MTAIADSRPTRTPVPHVTSLVLGPATAIVAMTLTTLFAHDWGEIATVAAVIVVAAAVVHGVVVPLARRRGAAGGAALTLGILAALVAVPAFWSGLPFVLGVAAVVLGHEARTAPRGAGKGIAGLALGALASLFYLSIYVMEGVAGQTGFLLG